MNLFNEIQCIFHRLWTHLPENIERATFYNRLFLGRNGNHPSYAVSSWRCSGRWLDLHIQVVYRHMNLCAFSVQYNNISSRSYLYLTEIMIILIIAAYAVDGFGAKGLNQRFRLDR